MTDTLRSCIIAEEDYTYIALDAVQLELVVLAVQSQDSRMLEDVKTGDLHQATSTRMFGWMEDEELRKRKRYDAKQGNFAVVYGATEEKIAEMLECSVQEALEFMQEHKATYPRLYEWMAERIRQAKEDGFVVNMFGRIRPIPELYAGSFRMREKAEREVVNTIVQGTAVDIVKMAMLYLRSILDIRVRLVLQVHDEILWECPDDILQQTLELCQELKQAFPQYPFTASVGKCYGELVKL